MNEMPIKELKPFGEKQLIKTVFEPLTEGADAAFSLKDDCACLHFDKNQDVVVTKDALVSNIHFFSDDPAADIGWKSLAVNLSDLAAKGANPHSYLLAIAIPENITLHWLREFAGGLKVIQNRGGCKLIGGDTVFTTGPLTISITAIGVGPRGSFVPRQGARVGDLVYVSGTIGDSAIGLQIRSKKDVIQSMDLSEADKNYLVRRFLKPEPRLNLADSLRRFARTSMDISDGLLGDFRTLCKASGVSGKVFFEDLPLSSATHNVLKQCKDPHHKSELIDIVVGGGDDYEIMAVIPPDSGCEFEKSATASGVNVKKIGEIEEGTVNQTAMFNRGQRVQPKSENYEHF